MLGRSHRLLPVLLGSKCALLKDTTRFDPSGARTPDLWILLQRDPISKTTYVKNTDKYALFLRKISAARVINPYVTNGLSHLYHLDESTFILGASGVFFFSFFDENCANKQNSPRLNAFCGVKSGCILFAYVT